MAYLNYEEYSDIVIQPIEEEVFNKLLKPATVKLDVLTNYFYSRVNLENDFQKRKEAFKTALAYQIDFYGFYGTSYSFEKNQPLSVTIGRTQQSIGDNNQRGINIEVPKEVLDILTAWGLLYRGVGTTQC